MSRDCYQIHGANFQLEYHIYNYRYYLSRRVQFFSVMLTKSHVAIRNSNYWAPVISPKSIINYPLAFMQIISIYIFLFLLPFSFPVCKIEKKWSTSCHVRCWFSFWNEQASGILDQIMHHYVEEVSVLVSSPHHPKVTGKGLCFCGKLSCQPIRY